MPTREEAGMFYASPRDLSLKKGGWSRNRHFCMRFWAAFAASTGRGSGPKSKRVRLLRDRREAFAGRLGWVGTNRVLSRRSFRRRERGFGMLSGHAQEHAGGTGGPAAA